MGTIFIRVDASIQIGIGHFMRCLTLANKLKERGENVHFLSRSLPEVLKKMLNQNRHDCSNLICDSQTDEGNKTAHHSWLNVSQSADALECIQIIMDSDPRIVIVDHYSLGLEWEEVLIDYNIKLVVIDDLADRKHNCHLLLDQNLFPDMLKRYNTLVSKNCILLLGPQYALLRDDFYEYRRKIRNRDGKIRRILVSLGGIDKENITKTVIFALNELPFLVEVDIVIGDSSPFKIEIMELCKESRFNLHIQTSKMTDLIWNADLGIGSSGASSWERCALGLPTICITQALNQVPIAKGLEGAGAVVNLGEQKIINKSIIKDCIVELINHPLRLRAMSNSAYTLVDSQGTSKVCDHILSF
jgi:UDP-2,4-diacetamido-2,4,6-trideoxy-beta-L-altropyranose hydrolase